MKKHTSIIFYFMISLILIPSCQNQKRNKVKEIVLEWVGKKVQLPEYIQFTVNGKDTTCRDLLNKPYKILLYVDSTGCTSCKFGAIIADWKDIMREIEIIAPGKVGFLFILFPKKGHELKYLIKHYRMSYPIIIDSSDIINKMNHFPQIPIYQCFLLNQNNQVLVVGDPALNLDIWALYKEQIVGFNTTPRKMQTTIEISLSVLDFGNIGICNKHQQSFTILNTGKMPLIIDAVKSSCGCITTKFSKRPIRPSEKVEVTVFVEPDEVGFFHKTLTVYCNTATSPISLYLKGVAE